MPMTVWRLHPSTVASKRARPSLYCVLYSSHYQIEQSIPSSVIWQDVSRRIRGSLSVHICVEASVARSISLNAAPFFLSKHGNPTDPIVSQQGMLATRGIWRAMVLHPLNGIYFCIVLLVHCVCITVVPMNQADQDQQCRLDVGELLGMELEYDAKKVNFSWEYPIVQRHFQKTTLDEIPAPPFPSGLLGLSSHTWYSGVLLQKQRTLLPIRLAQNTVYIT